MIGWLFCLFFPIFDHSVVTFPFNQSPEISCFTDHRPSAPWYKFHLLWSLWPASFAITRCSTIPLGSPLLPGVHCTHLLIHLSLSVVLSFTSVTIPITCCPPGKAACEADEEAPGEAATKPAAAAVAPYAVEALMTPPTPA